MDLSQKNLRGKKCQFLKLNFAVLKKMNADFPAKHNASYKPTSIIVVDFDELKLNIFDCYEQLRGYIDNREQNAATS